MQVNIQWQGLVLLLVFIAPGFVFARSYAAFYPSPRYYRGPDVFAQTVLSVVASTLIHALLVGALVVLVLVYSLIRDLSGVAPPFLRDFVSAPLQDFPLSYLAVDAVLVIVYLLISLVVAYRFGAFLGRLSTEEVPRWLRRISGRIPPENILLWHTVLQKEPIKLGTFPSRLVVRLRNGEVFQGRLIRMQLCGDESNTIELVLENAFYSPAADTTDGSSVLKVLQGHKVVLRSSDILWLSRVDTPQSEAAG